MPEAVLLVPVDLAQLWQDLPTASGGSSFARIPGREEELVDPAELTVAALQVAGYIADVSAVAMLLVPAVRKVLKLRRDQGKEAKIAVRRRDEGEAPIWLVLDGAMSDDELRAQIERAIEARPRQSPQAPR